jgi:hypothetical protein
MKKCSRCQIEKPIDCFNKNKTKKDGFQTMCKECSRAKSRKYYYDNHDKHIGEVGKRKKKVILENRKMLFEFYKTHPCIDCGESDPLVLELDHLRDKDECVSRAVGTGWSKERIIKEINKCVVRCANCHRRKTAKDQGWYKDLM